MTEIQSLLLDFLTNIRCNNKDLHCNNIVDTVLILYLKKNNLINPEIKEKIIKILKKGDYTKFKTNLEIFIFYYNIFNLLSKNNNKKYFLLNKEKLSTKKMNEQFKIFFNRIFGENTGRKKFEILKYWSDMTNNNAKKTNLLISYLKKEGLIKELEGFEEWIKNL